MLSASLWCSLQWRKIESQNIHHFFPVDCSLISFLLLFLKTWIVIFKGIFKEVRLEGFLVGLCEAGHVQPTQNQCPSALVLNISLVKEEVTSWSSKTSVLFWNHHESGSGAPCCPQISLWCRKMHQGHSSPQSRVNKPKIQIFYPSSHDLQHEYLLWYFWVLFAWCTSLSSLQFPRHSQTLCCVGVALKQNSTNLQESYYKIHESTGESQLNLLNLQIYKRLRCQISSWSPRWKFPSSLLTQRIFFAIFRKKTLPRLGEMWSCLTRWRWPDSL